MPIRYSKAYIRLQQQGPFPGRIDPFAEAGRYFQQIHAGMIGHLLEQIQWEVAARGYLAGRETSLQIADGRQPDLFVEQVTMPSAAGNLAWDYGLAAEEVLAKPGVLVAETPELYGVSVREAGQLVTVVEVISPRNKAYSSAIYEYQLRRDALVAHHVNVVEIDLTRSVMRLISDKLVAMYSYHVAVHLPGQPPRFIGIAWDEALPRVALPLRNEVVLMVLQDAYRHAYEVARVAAHIENETGYRQDALPFASTLTEPQQQAAMQAVQAWRAALKQLMQDG